VSGATRHDRPRTRHQRSIHADSFDDILMRSTTAHSITRDLLPVGFTYAIYSARDAAPKLIQEGAYGVALPSGAAMTVRSRKECDSMSKTISAASILQQVSLVPDVRAAFDDYRSASAAHKDAKRQAWSDRAHHWLNRPIARFVPGVSGDDTDWSAFDSASAITIKDLLCHTSGLSLTASGGGYKVDGGGDDWATIQHDLGHWSTAKHDAARASTDLFYSNTNFALLRYVIAFFNLIAVCGLSDHDAHHQITGTWDERDRGLGALYRNIAQVGIFGNVADPRPDVEPTDHDVWYFSADRSASLDISHCVPEWLTMCGAWGWKLTARQYAHAMASLVSGQTLPTEYWDLMTDMVDSTPARYAFGTGIAYSAHSEIGTYYSHNGGDGDGRASGGGVWFEWDHKVFVLYINSPFSGDFGVRADGSDHTGDYLFRAFDDALANSLA
jgi:hypothetical protein